MNTKTRPKRSQLRIREQVTMQATTGNQQQRVRRKLSQNSRVNLPHRTGSGLPLACSIALLAILSVACSVVEAQCPNGTMTSFERIGSVAIKDLPLTVLYTAPNISSTYGGSAMHLSRPAYGGDMSGLVSSLSGLHQQPTPITAECNNRCRKSGRCRAFLVDYARHTCYSVEGPVSQMQISSSGLMRAPPPIHLVPTQERTSYFEKVCLNLPAIECERAWVYERVIGYQLHGYDDKIIEDVQSRLKCQEYCLNEVEFRCRSGEYDLISMQCRLSMVDRHLKPNAFRPTTNNVDYFENQCVPVGNQCDAFDQYENMDLGRAEIMRSANTSDQCQQFCTQTIKAFICRSFTWNPLTGKCYLNSANSFMVGGLDRLIRAPGLIYHQRNDCIDLKLECDTTAMTLNLRTNEPFRGRMYVRDDPNACEVMGRSSLTSTLSIPFQSHARCAVREPPNRFTSVVVVQQHPMIQRKSDRYIKVVCDFQTANKTITSSYNVVNNPWTSTALINATSFAPKIRLRITDRHGVDITGAKLGDELYLRIEAETESVYDMVARSVLAKSGITDESIMLIDKDGCPTDSRIFPELRKLNRRTIVGKFDAFKFSSDVVVRFQVDVQFCLNQCPSTSCDSNNLYNMPQDAFNGEQIANQAQQQQQQQQPSQMQTTVSPTSSTSNLPQHNLNSMNHINHDSSLVTAFGSTQAPVPFQHQQQQRTTSLASSQNQTPLPQLAAASGGGNNGDNRPSMISNQNNNNIMQSNYSSMMSNQDLNDGYYYSNAASASAAAASMGAHNSMGGRHPSMPANMPAAPGDHQISTSFMNSGDPQMFEPAQPRSAPTDKSTKMHLDPGSSGSKTGSGNQQLTRTRAQQKTTQLQQQQAGVDQQLAGNSLLDGPTMSPTESTSGPADLTGGTTSSAAEQQQQQQQQEPNRLRRRRRSAEPMPRQPSHVPLQREIIVEGSNSQPQLQSDQQPAGSGSKSPQVQQQQPQNHRGAKSSGRRKKIDSSKADVMNRNGPAYDLNGNPKQEPLEEQQQAADNGTLLCTTRHSLVIASMAFCMLQVFTIGLCMVTWMHRRVDTKFKVRHPVEERLY